MWTVIAVYGLRLEFAEDLANIPNEECVTVKTQISDTVYHSETYSVIFYAGL